MQALVLSQQSRARPLAKEAERSGGEVRSKRANFEQVLNRIIVVAYMKFEFPSYTQISCARLYIMLLFI